MRALALDEIVARQSYAALRPEYRAAVIAHKRDRRLSVGEHITLVFEDRETLRFQVQEMLWVEGIGAPDKIQYELDTYNELMPASGELSATLFIEITESREIRPALDRLIGVDENVELVLGDDESSRVRARFDPRQMDEDRISAVQYIKWQLDADQQRDFCDPRISARIRIDHPSYTREVEIPPATRASLAAGLSGEPDCLLPLAGRETQAPRPVLLFESDGARALRPARPLAPGHTIVEPIEPIESLLEANPDQLAALMTAVQQVASAIVEEFGACRVQTQIDAQPESLRWHLFAPPT